MSTGSSKPPFKRPTFREPNGPSRYAIIDHTSPRITYLGTWTSISETVSDVETPGSRHASSSRDVGFSLTFHGSEFYIVYAFPPPIVTAYNLSLTVDGAPSPEFHEGVVSPGQHLLEANITEVTAFYLNQVHYSPRSLDDHLITSEEGFQDTRVALRGHDKNVTWGAGWTQDAEIGWSSTNKTGSELSVTFYGVGIVFTSAGDLDAAGKQPAAGTSTYILDNGPEVDFKVSYYEIYHTMLRIQDLCLSTHTITIRYTGDRSANGLRIADPIEILHPVSVDKAPPCPVPSDTVISAAESGPAKSVPTGTIVGAVIGGVLGLFLLLLLFRRRVHARATSVTTRLRARIIPIKVADGVEKGNSRSLSPFPYTSETLSTHKAEEPWIGHKPTLPPLQSSKSLSNLAPTPTIRPLPEPNLVSSAPVSRPAHSTSTPSRPHLMPLSTRPTSTEGTFVLQHVDSGIRITREVPPVYSDL